ncbi:hypothetical protein JH06_2979 [Blastocystis sp. subtype 4]|uniref:hypothetical protein n=1 Tax=Blastocystis sp. subtype 4 TaxID=944170 RepID=UPI0007113D2B|nr:hypothetical protein JH06_2979 [Blastocystis sp. subtype 4]KNB46629.1 hypothetical protein JH06_2979 [Blastocystis sp. subtype 4]|eukprot:XP_014530100.1 hypothetical protein JH06_2979 [Blastocystis sp. subtype 4]
MKRSERTLKHLGAEADYDKEHDRSIFLTVIHGTKNDLMKDVSGITPFNLKEENEEGRFDANGDFHAKKNKDEEEIEMDVYTRDMYKEGLAKVPIPKEEDVLTKSFSQNMQFVRLCSYLQAEEVPRDAIQRFGKILNPKKSKSKRHLMAFEKGWIRTVQ